LVFAWANGFSISFPLQLSSFSSESGIEAFTMALETRCAWQRRCIKGKQDRMEYGMEYGKRFQEQHREEYRTAAAIETGQSNLLSIIIIYYRTYYRIVLLASSQNEFR
jgi:hypothetical protein